MIISSSTDLEVLEQVHRPEPLLEERERKAAKRVVAARKHLPHQIFPAVSIARHEGADRTHLGIGYDEHGPAEQFVVPNDIEMDASQQPSLGFVVAELHVP